MTEASSIRESALGSRQRGWLSYIGMGILCNAAIWGLVLYYLKVTPPTYTSKWGIMILGSGGEANLTLANIGKATSENQTSAPVPSRDPRDDYVYIVTSPAVLEKAAAQVEMSVKEFSSPEIGTPKGSAIISFEVSGSSPEEAQKKSQALYRVMTEEIERLREAVLKSRQQETRTALQSARQRLNATERNFANYQDSSALLSGEQIKQISLNLEDLRRYRAELIAREQGLRSRMEQLSRDLKLSSDLEIFSPEVDDAYILQADDVYQQYLQEYGKINAELANLESQLGPLHPHVVEKRAALEAAAATLQTRGSFLLGRPVTQKTLVRIKPLTLDPNVRIVRQELYRDLVINRADQRKLEMESKTLEQEIALLESRLKNLAQQQVTVDNLKREIQIAQAIFASSIAKLDLGKGNIYSIYPIIQLVAPPSLPDRDKPTAPKPRLIFLGGAAASIIVTIALILLWLERSRPPEPSTSS